jgi:hypothetical protein
MKIPFGYPFKGTGASAVFIDLSRKNIECFD